MDSIDNNDEILDFNFWPTFADLMLALLLILIFFYAAVVSTEAIYARNVRALQMGLIIDIVKYTKTESMTETASGAYVLGKDIVVLNEPTVQKISFTDNILFDVRDHHIHDRGKVTLRIVSEIIKIHLDSIREIQIQAHADISPMLNDSNLNLGSRRANEVYEFLKNQGGIDPATHLMSATSFGEFKPVNRLEEDSGYNRERLQKDNETSKQRALNRRIELLLFYKLSEG